MPPSQWSTDVRVKIRVVGHRRRQIWGGVEVSVCVSVAVRPPRDFIKFAVDRGELPCLSYPNKKSMPEKTNDVTDSYDLHVSRLKLIYKQGTSTGRLLVGHSKGWSVN